MTEQDWRALEAHPLVSVSTTGSFLDAEDGDE